MRTFFNYFQNYCLLESRLVLFSLQLATCDFYGDFLLLDPCDAPAVDDFLQTNYVVEESVLPSRGSSVRSKGRNGFFASPTGRSGGSARKSTHKETQGINLDRNLEQNFDFVDNENYNRDYPDHNNFEGEQPNFGCSSVRDDSDDEYEDPWKPLNPHEPGDLKIKPFKKGNFIYKICTNHNSVFLFSRN